MKEFAIALALCVGVVFIWAAAMAIGSECHGLQPGCLFDEDGWLSNYQTLVSGVLALVAAGVVYGQGTNQLNFEKAKAKTAELAEIERRKLEALGLLATMANHYSRLWRACEQNNWEEFKDAQASAYRTSEAIGRYHHPGLSNWLDYQVTRATAWVQKLRQNNFEVAMRRSIAQAHLNVAQRYLDGREQLVAENGQIVLLIFDDREIFETVDATGKPRDEFLLDGYFRNPD